MKLCTSSQWQIDNLTADFGHRPVVHYRGLPEKKQQHNGISEATAFTTGMFPMR